MNIYLYIAYIFGFLVNSYIFWAFLQLALASWGSNKASEKWVMIVNTPSMQLIPIKWLSLVFSVAMAIQLFGLLILISISFYTGEPININR